MISHAYYRLEQSGVEYRDDDIEEAWHCVANIDLWRHPSDADGG